MARATGAAPVVGVLRAVLAGPRAACPVDWASAEEEQVVIADAYVAGVVRADDVHGVVQGRCRSSWRSAMFQSVSSLPTSLVEV